MSLAENFTYQARDLAASGDLDGAILMILRNYGEETSQGIVSRLGMPLTASRRIAGRLRSLEHRSLVQQRYTGFTNTNYWIAR